MKFPALATIALAGLLLARPAAALEIPQGDPNYFAGLGLAVTFCATCYDVGPMGPTDQFTRAPSFEKFVSQFNRDPKQRRIDITEYLTLIRDLKVRHPKMPPFGFDDAEIKWLAQYLTLSDFK